MKNNIYILVMILITGSIIFGQQQQPDLKLKRPQAEIDSLLKNYTNILPIWGKEAVAQGFDLPKPVGLNLNYLYMRQDIDVTNLQLGVNGSELVPVDFIKFGKSDSKISTVNGRLDAWIFPFLNFYGLYGKMYSRTTVIIEEPVEFQSAVDFEGIYYGFGISGAFGLEKNWLAVDANWTWTDLDKLNELVRGRVLGIRFGRTFPLGGTKKVAFWVGTMNQKLLNTTTGSVILSEVIPSDVSEQINDYQNSDWYQEKSPPVQGQIDEFMEQLLNSNLGDTKIDYSLDKQPAQKWNLLLGGQFEFNKGWQVRAEVGLIKRFSILINANYRLDF